MRRAISILAICAVAASATIIDRIAVSVGNRVISTSDIDRELRVTAFLNGVKPDFSPKARRDAANRMVEQTLVRSEVESNRYPAPTTAEVQATLEQFKKQRYPNEASYQKALSDDGIKEQDLLNELSWQKTLLSYIEVRFRPTVQVTDQEIQDYFAKVVKPAAEAAHPGRNVSLDQYSAQIEEALSGQKEDQELNRWLAQAKQRNQVVYHEEAFQ